MPDESITATKSAQISHEQGQTLVDRLSSQFQRADRSATGLPLLSNLKEYETWLDQAYTFFRESSQSELSLTYASEWVLDNYYVVREAIEQIHEDLPAGYYQRMPKLLDGPAAAYPRIYAIVCAILNSQNNLLHVNELQNTLNVLQDQFALTIGEVWAVPIFLRFCVVEALSTALEEIIRPPDRPHLPRISANALASYQPEDGPVSPSTVVANSIISLRAIAEMDWRDFFDSVSQVELLLREDPADVYASMDFPTRDLYRKQIEALAFSAEMEEIAVTQRALELARQAAQHGEDRSPTAGRLSHVGYYLIDDGRVILEKQIGYASHGRAAFERWVMRHPTAVYLGGALSITALLLGLLSLAVLLPAPQVSYLILGLLLLSIVPAFTIATHLVNWLVTLWIRPRILPKRLFRGEIPPQFHTLVVIPSLIGSTREIDTLTRQLLLHSLRNPETGLSFALLTDFNDAQSEQTEGDEALLAYAVKEIEQLNLRYPGAGGKKRFFLLHRRRVLNPSEGRWIGWERKRGKLHELNQLLLHNDPQEIERLTFIWPGEKVDVPEQVRFVITLDADTELPSGAARRLVGALAHPLNRAIFDPRTGQVTSGYTILQPRVEISPHGSGQTWFTRIFAGDTGLDLYSRAVSDAYMDLFGEGIYVGKGIYDVAAFDQSVFGHIPENTVLSHDLLEGSMGRAGLVSDITLVEDYPPDYLVQTMRQQRWIRGDWQLLPWLFMPGRFGVRLTAIDRWKLTDNLRRSLLAPVLLAIFIPGIIFFPHLSGLWSAVVLFTLGVSAITSLIQGIKQAISSKNLALGAALGPAGLAALRSLIAVAFIPYEALKNLDSIFTTLYRLFITRRNLLQWTTAAHTIQLLRTQNESLNAWQRFVVNVVIGLSLGVWLGMRHPQHLTGALPVLLLWIAAPLISGWINAPAQDQAHEPLSEEDTALLRLVARLTWAFFERYVGPEDHWLPPDHFQESPVGVVAHRTSPTNIGLLLTSTLSAYDLGYLDPLVVASRLTATFDTLKELERFRGHFLNWYDTLNLQPLHPRYVSTVDSGNLAACLIVTAQSCRMLPEAPIFRWELWQGYLDSLAMLRGTLKSLYRSPHTRPSGTVHQQVEIEEKIDGITQRIRAVKDTPRSWYALFQEISGPFWIGLAEDLGKLVSAGPIIFDLETLRSLQQIAAQIERQHLSVQRIIHELVPWIPLLENPPSVLSQPERKDQLAVLRDTLSYRPSLIQLREMAANAQPSLDALRERLGQLSSDEGGGPDRIQEALGWIDDLSQAIVRGQSGAGVLLSGYNFLAEEAEKYVREMDFTFLYHPQRRIFHLGYNLESSQLDNNFYDLLASEARIASLVAISKGDVPLTHWIQLSRPVTSVEGRRVLLSWSATMFEYLMPPLFFRAYSGTLLAESASGAVIRQIAYGQSKGVPWGISESGFYRFDASQSYQYRAFGVPGLGFKRGLSDDLVIAPYASLMALGYDPRSVVQNIHDLIDLNMLGLYGFYEAADFTPGRLLVGERVARVQEYMAHHQGMILLAIDNFFNSEIMIQRMFRDPRIQSIDLLLQEQVPMDVPLRHPHSEEVKGSQRVIPAQVEVNPWTVPVHTPVPQVHLLSNGSYSVVLANSGSGYSSWRDVDLTRWRPDGTLDEWGSWIYIEDRTHSNLDGPADALWSAGFQPVPGSIENMQVTFFAHMAVQRRSEGSIITTTEVTVSPDDPLEIRRLHIFNSSSAPRLLRLTSYGEVILTHQSADARHPAFNKLFIESEFVPELNLQIFKRRPRSDSEAPVFLGHMLVLSGKTTPDKAHEADRRAFVGRHGSIRSPHALSDGQYLSGASGATLDPIFSLGQQITLGGHEIAVLAYLTFAADSREEILALANRYQNWTLIERAFQQADISQQSWLTQQNMDTQAIQMALQTLSAMLYPHSATRAPSEALAANRLGQPALWRFGISGDYPILLVEIKDPRHIELVRQALQVHRYLRHRRFLMDVIIVNHQQVDYGAELNAMLYRLVSRVNSEQWLNQRGGIFILYSTQMQPEEYTLIQVAARLILQGERGLLADQMPGYSIPVQHLPEFRASRLEMPIPHTAAKEELDVSRLVYFNGLGGFTPDGKEYLIRLEPGRPTPAPWINVIGYPHFGCFVTETGSGCTWSLNSGENRLTPWSNDPVRDPSGEMLYLRDEETGAVWSPTPQPVGSKNTHIVRHGAGYTVFESTAEGIHHQLRIYVSPHDPVKLIHLRLENLSGVQRQITATQYIEWVLGTTRAITQAYIIPEFDPERACLLATNPYSQEFSGRYAFLAASRPIRGVTADRVEFLGRAGTPASPAALSRLGLESRIIPGEDPCAVLQVQLDLAPNGATDVYFILGQGSSREEALALADRYRESAQAETAWKETQSFWGRLLGRVQVKTPQPAIDLILNQWMLYQALSCRLWGRTAFYQSSGAFGFRDQLQDVLALRYVAPELMREHILTAARHQFTEGDVLHWWHPPSGRGIRTLFSDDLLWLPYVTAHYIEATGDFSILDEPLPFRHGPLLLPGEEERYGEYPLTEETYTLLEHCRRAIEKGSTTGVHGLPLMGTGDWNDGMNQVGSEGRGESIWLAWFLIDVLNRFAAVLEQHNPEGSAEWILLVEEYRRRAKAYTQAIEDTSWDGAWYRRAYYDDGAPLGSATNEECQIDAIAQSWAVLSRAGQLERSAKAVQSVLERLVRPEDRLLLLFTPPFDNTSRNPGYIKGYLPGIRENGGQYTHAAIWTAWSVGKLGLGDQAGRLFDFLNPIFHADDEERTAQYRVEPYVICADIYSVPPYNRRGGWTWYTGSASWMYRLGIEGLLGFSISGSGEGGPILNIDPVIPAAWDGYEITYRYGSSTYYVQVSNPQHVTHGVQQITIDGTIVAAVTLLDDRQEHHVHVKMG